MQLSVEISCYPLKDEYLGTIQAFIDRLNAIEDIKVITNTMSTQIFGDYDLVMDTLKAEIRRSIEAHGNSIYVCKFIGKDLRPE